MPADTLTKTQRRLYESLQRGVLLIDGGTGYHAQGRNCTDAARALIRKGLVARGQDGHYRACTMNRITEEIE